MKLQVAYRPSLPASASPYRLLDAHGHELAWVNDFLDVQRIRQLSVRSLRAYAYDLLHFARWAQDTPHEFWRRSPSLHCSIMSAINSINNRSPRRKP